MTKIEGINLKTEVANAETTLENERLTNHRQRVAGVVRELLRQIKYKQQALVDRAVICAEYQKNNDFHQTVEQARLDIDLLRLEAIKGGNWDALDREFGQPKSDTNANYAPTCVVIEDTDEIERFKRSIGKGGRGK